MSAVRRFHEEKRGAVMILSLFMSMFMIGNLWFLIGIGDAVVWRQRMQEAPDHAGFSSAVVHAKGMNFIAMLNSVMLVLVIIYILMGIIHDILALLCVMTGYACIPFKAWQQVWHGYFNVMKPICRAIHTAEEAIAYGAPWVGMGVGAKLGQEYGQKTHQHPKLTVLPMSLSMMPGRTMGDGSTGRGMAKFGLPTEAKPFSALCDKVGRLAEGSGGIMGMTGMSPGAAGGVMSGMLSAGLKARYCSGFDLNGFIQGNDTRTKSGFSGVMGNFISIGKRAVSRFAASAIGALLGNDPSLDSFWNEDGPLYVYSGAENGNSYFQIWTFNMFPKFVEARASRVGISANRLKGRGIANTPPVARAYFSQSEFYYDCTKEWSDNDCHGDPDLDANASYNMRWTVRMHAFEGDFGTKLGGAFSDLITSGISMGIRRGLEKMNLPAFVSDQLGTAIGTQIGDALGLDKDGGTRGMIQDQLDFMNVQQTPYH